MMDTGFSCFRIATRPARAFPKATNVRYAITNTVHLMVPSYSSIRIYAIISGLNKQLSRRSPDSRASPGERKMTRLRSGSTLCAFMLMVCANLAFAADAIEWPAYGRDPEGTRYLPATQITRDNVPQLEIAWTYRTGETAAQFSTSEETAFETTPIVIDGVMYISTPLGRVMALDPATGEERWNFDPQIRRNVSYGDFASRGLSTWLDSSTSPGAVC